MILQFLVIQFLKIVCAKLLAMPNSLRPYGLYTARLFCPWDSLAKDTGVGCHALLQAIFLTQRSNPCFLWLLHWQANSLPQAPPGKPIASYYE